MNYQAQQRTCRNIVAIISCIASVGTRAQQPVDPTAQVEPVPTVMVTAKEGTYDPRRDDTAAKIVVGSDELSRFGDSNIADALKRVPGITVISTGRGADIRMRGLGSGYTQILVNGERAPVGFSIDSLSPAQVERVEIIRSATAEYSTESIAGTINIVLKKTVRTAQRQAQLGYGGDATERTPRAMLLLADRAGAFSYSVTANSRVSSFHRDPRINDVETTPAGTPVTSSITESDEAGRFSALNLIPRLNWTLENGDTVTSESTLSLETLQFSSTQSSTATLGAPQEFTNFDWRIQTRKLAAKSDLLWARRLTPATKLEVKAGVQATTGTNDSARLLRDDLVTRPSVTAVDTKDKGFNTSGKLTSTLLDAHQLTTGWEASRLRRNEWNDETDIAVSEGNSVRSLTDFTGTVIRAAAFVQDEWTVTPNWSLYLGARVERIVTSVGASDSHWRTASDVWSPLIQTLVKLPGLPDDQIRIALTRTFKAPDLNSLTPRRRRIEVNASTNPDVDGNPLLRPEIAQGIDITYEHYFSKTALLSVGASARHIDDYTLTLVSLGDDGRWVGRPVNAGQAQVRGLEFEAKFPLSLLKAEWPAIDLRGSLSRNWSTVDQVPGPDNRVAQQIPLQATVGADYAFATWTAGGSFVYRKGTWTTVTMAQRSLTVSRRDLDFYALWKRNSHQQIRFTLSNLLSQGDFSASQFVAVTGNTTRTINVTGHISVRALFEQKF